MKKKKWQLKMTRRQVLKAGMIGGAGLMLPLRFLPAKAFADPIITGLHDPDWQTLFRDDVPDALSPDFKYSTFSKKGKNVYRVGAGVVENPLFPVGLVDLNDNPLNTPCWGYGQIDGDPWYSWPGRTFEVKAGRRTVVQWSNNLPIDEEHLLPVDTTLHWCYSLHGYEDYSIKANGVPTVMHLHGGHTKDLFDGNPEQFFSPGNAVSGPRHQGNTFVYDNDRPAGNLWYHDHALGITRLNVYAGMAGFYFVRDENDTGRPGNPLKLPAWPYEKAYAIQDRMFKANGELFYPAFPGDPAYADFIDPIDLLPCVPFDQDPRGVNKGCGGPTALAEFFGDHMVVNGVVWPKESVEPRYYRLHLLNGTDSRFMLIKFVVVDEGVTDPSAGTPISFDVIGSDQGLASSITTTQTLLSEPGSRYDIIVDFNPYGGKRIIMQNLGGDEPFGTGPGESAFKFTDRIMAFDVELGEDKNVLDVHPTNSEISFGPDVPTDPDRTRKVALFEGKDEFGRLQPLLGTAEPATNFKGRPINWPDTQPYIDAGLTGQMEGSIAWHSPTTENPRLNTTEEWEVWNVTGDAHPIHLHLVHFEILGRKEINFDSNADEDGFLQTTLELATTLSSATESEVVVDSIPTYVPQIGTIRVIDDLDVEHEVGYTSWSVDTFSLDRDYDFSGANAASAGNDVIAQTTPADDGAYVVPQPVVQHNGDVGKGFRIVHPTADPMDAYGADVTLLSADGYVENAPKDMVTALPGQITRIKARFDKPGRYVWHCHILSHEDHEMMRVLHVGGGHKDPSP